MKLLQRIRRALGRLFRRRSWGQIFYINGPDILPAPLEKEEEEALIAEARESAEKRARLISHNLRLVVYIAKKFESTGIGIEDLISIGTMGLMKAISTFCPDKNIKLATYASRCIENEILMYIRKTGCHRREVSFDEPLNVDWDGNELLLSDILGSDADAVCRDIEEREERGMVRRLVRELGEREREIIEMRYGLGGRREMTQKEVAEALGISQSYISRLEKKIIADLRREMLQKL